MGEPGLKDRYSHRCKVDLGVEELVEHQGIGGEQRKGRFRDVCTAFVFACLVAALLTVGSFRTSGSPSTLAIRRDRLGERLRVTEDNGIGALLDEATRGPVIEDVVAVPNQALLLLLTLPHGFHLPRKERLSCFFGNQTFTEVLSAEVYKSRSGAVRCPYPSAGSVWTAGNVTVVVDNGAAWFPTKLAYRKPLSWNFLVYDIWSTQADVVLFAKGLKHIRNREGLLTVQCVYDGKVHVSVTEAAQEVFRCPHPDASEREELLGQPVTLKVNGVLVPSVVRYECDNKVLKHGSTSPHSGSGVVSHGNEEYAALAAAGCQDDVPVPGDAESRALHTGVGTEKHFLCSCNLIRDGAKFLKEWVTYHSHLGVSKFFFYDNNSDDDIEDVIAGLVFSNYQVTRVIWPWIKNQEAGFGHCALLAAQECTWMMYADVDEYAFPKMWLILSSSASPASTSGKHKESCSKSIAVPRGDSRKKQEGPLISLIQEAAPYGQDLKKVGQVSLYCRDFGPSGLMAHPVQGVTVGYSCRLNASPRHKSIVLLEAIDKSLRNVIHHFDLGADYRTVKLLTNKAVFNHYKFQAWDEFKSKYKQRVSAYVPDWTDSKSSNSQDKVPLLGSTAVRPDDWESQFCEVEDTALRDYVLKVFAVCNEPEQRMIWQ